MSVDTDLARAKISRDNALAAVADAEMRLAAAAVGATEETRQAYQRRLSRRRAERTAGIQHVIPPGPWDADLDAYHKNGSYEVALEGGYKATLQRGWMTWSWNGYLTLHEGHCCHGVDYLAFDCYGHLGHIGGGPPVNLTFGRPSEGVFGFDHGNTWDGWPYRAWFTGNEREESNGGGEYMDFAAVLEEIRGLADFFHRVESDHREEVVATLKK